MFHTNDLGIGDIMNTALDKASHTVQRAAVGKLIDVTLSKLDRDREKGFLEILDLAKQFWGENLSE